MNDLWTSIISHFGYPRNSFARTCILFAFVATGTSTAAQPLNNCIEESRLSMGCVYSIKACGADATTLTRAAIAALDEVDRLDRLMSNYKIDSPLSAINRDAARSPVHPGRELFDFLELCQEYSRLSDGAFDITVGPLMKAWGFFRGQGRLPPSRELHQARRAVGYRNLILDRETVAASFAKPGMELDLGGIAKGYAVDRAASVLRQNGVPCGLISAGGSTIFGFGMEWEIQIQDPVSSNIPGPKVTIRDQALSISGTAEKYFVAGGRRYSHIMDPCTGRPAGNVLSVAVITGTGTSGDALDNIFFVLGVEESRRRIARFPGTEIRFFLPRGNGRWSESIIKGPVMRR